MDGVDDLEKLTTDEVRKKAKENLDQYIAKRGSDHHTLLIDAEYYLRELNRRAEKRSRRFDRFLELIIIALIGWEIYGAWEQGRLLLRQTVILEHIEKALNPPGATRVIR